MGRKGISFLSRVTRVIETMLKKIILAIFNAGKNYREGSQGQKGTKDITEGDKRYARGRNVKPSLSVVYKYWEEVLFLLLVTHSVEFIEKEEYLPLSFKI